MLRREEVSLSSKAASSRVPSTIPPTNQLGRAGGRLVCRARGKALGQHWMLGHLPAEDAMEHLLRARVRGKVMSEPM